MGTERTPEKPTARRYTPEEKAQAVRLVRQLRAETGQRHGSVKRVAEQLGYGVESVRNWVNQADVDGWREADGKGNSLSLQGQRRRQPPRVRRRRYRIPESAGSQF